MKLTVLERGEAVSRELALRVSDVVRVKPSAALGLASGRTPIDGYAEMRRMHARGEMDWAAITTFNLDEFVGIDGRDTGSFRQFMQHYLFSGMNLDPARIHFLSGTARNLDAECARYEEGIVAAGGIDLLTLGIGVNGHIGFNEPADELIARTHCVTLLEATRRDNAALFGGNLARVPRQALTMGVGTILQARRIVLVAIGVAKAEAIRDMVRSGVTTMVPASLLQLHGDVELLLDEGAAARI